MLVTCMKVNGVLVELTQDQVKLIKQGGGVKTEMSVPQESLNIAISAVANLSKEKKKRKSAKRKQLESQNKIHTGLDAAIVDLCEKYGHTAHEIEAWLNERGYKDVPSDTFRSRLHYLVEQGWLKIAGKNGRQFVYKQA